MLPLDRLLTELRSLPPDERHPVWVLRRFHELGEVTEPPTVDAPPWLQRTVVDAVRAVSQSWPQSGFFGAVRMLERWGLAKVEHDDVYVLAMVSCLGDRWDGAVRTDALRRDSELREELWRVFEVEGGGEVSLSNVDKYSRPEATWVRTFHELVADGTLPRDRVLTGCLRALARDFSSYRAGWFSQTYRGFTPTAAELVAHQPLLLRLLRSAVPATVSFSVAQLAAVARQGALDDDRFVAECAGATLVRARSAAVAAITLAAGAAQRRPDLVPAVVEAVGTGLGHPHRDVQFRALAVLQSLEARETVAAGLPELEPSVRRAASKWLGVPVPRDPDQGAPGVVEPVLQADTTVAELGARLLAGHLHPADVERFLAALAVGDTAGLDTVRTQARTTVSNPRWEGTLRRGLAALVMTAAGGPAPAAARPDTFLARRLAEVADVLTGRRAPAALLATPTDAAGWIDPRVFVARLAANPAPPPYDLVAALLRLATDGRADALRSARTLPGEPGAAARYALGGEPAEVTDRALWVAAARSRAPLADDPHLIAAGADGAGRGRAASYSLRLRARENRYNDGGKVRVHTWYEPSLDVTPPGVRERADQPTIAGPWDSRRGSGAWGLLDPDWIPWHASIWPHDAEPFFAVRVEEVLNASSASPEVTYGTAAVLDALVTHPGRLGPMAAATLAAALSASEVQYRVQAAEAFAGLVPAGRMTPEALAHAMVHLAGHCTATRWSATLRDAARTGPDAAAAVVRVLDHLLPHLATNHPGVHALLETRYEEAVGLGHRAVDEPLRAWLQGFRGGSKATRVARLILTEATA